jgi:ATP-dependent Clp protease ATP-binding subunit ClpA
MTAHYSAETQRILKTANENVKKVGSAALQPEHVLLAMLKEPFFKELQVKHKLDVNILETELNQVLKGEVLPIESLENPSDEMIASDVKRSEDAWKEIDATLKSKFEATGRAVTPVELLGHFHINRSSAVRLLYKRGFPHKALEAMADLGEAALNDVSATAAPVQDKLVKYVPRFDPNKAPTLMKYGKYMNKEARDGKYQRSFGVDENTETMFEILGRLEKNNPIVLGHPGVGKTQLVESLVLDIVNKNAPEKFQNAHVVSITAGDLTAGTKYRGEFEERMRNVIKEAIENNIILYVDEIHSLIGAGDAEGGVDASSMLKTAMISDGLTVIGSTTFDEYNKYMKKDKALTRRLQQVFVDEPSIGLAKEILEYKKPRFEKHHGVTYSAEMISLMVDLSARYIMDRKLPDKAIDIMDIVGTKVATAVHKGKHDGAVKENDVMDVIAKLANIPALAMKENDKDKMRNLEANLKSRIFGQDEAVSKVVNTVKRAKAGLSDPNKPLGVFIMSGPTGVGKTELARVLSDTMSMNFVKLDMGQYTESHSVASLLGAQPGYVGYEDGSKLGNEITNKPHSVIVFDELEKAHPNVLKALLNIIETGVATDSGGREINFRNTVIMMTTNIGAVDNEEKLDNHAKKKTIGFVEPSKADVKKEFDRIVDKTKAETFDLMRKTFQPEFVNRTEVVMFNSLDVKHMASVAKKTFDELSARLKNRSKGSIALNVTKDVLEFVAQKAFSPRDGARPIKRYIESKVEEKLTDVILLGALEEGGSIKISVDKNKDELKYSFKSAAKILSEKERREAKQAVNDNSTVSPAQFSGPQYKM